VDGITAGGTTAGGRTGGCGLTGDRQLPLDLAAAGMRLVLIDPRMRAAPRPAPAERSPIEAALEALSVGDIIGLGPMLTAAHHELRAALPAARSAAEAAADDVQHGAVQAALRGGAAGARMIADGPGRPACALAFADQLPAVRAEVSAWFAGQGLRPPRLLTFTPSPGPRRLSISSH
jgi:galactokinase